MIGHTKYVVLFTKNANRKKVGIPESYSTVKTYVKLNLNT